MELIVIIAVAVVLVLILGASIETVLVGVLFLLGTIMGLITVFFAVCGTGLIRSEKCRGEFVRIDRCQYRNFPCAYYRVNGNEYPNIFPCEIIFKNRIYRNDISVKLFLTAGKKYVFDKNAVYATIIGLVFGTVSTVGIMWSALRYI